MLITVIDFNCRGIGAIGYAGEIPGYLATFTSESTTGYRPGIEQLVIFRIRCISNLTVLSVGVQLGELVPGGHGRTIAEIDGVTEVTVGAWLMYGGFLALRCPTQN